MSRKIRWAAFLIIMILTFVAGKDASAGCISNATNSLTCEDDGTNCYCSGSGGGGCSACFTRGGRGDGSWDLCYTDWVSGDEDCFYSD